MTENTKSFGAEIRLNSGQLARVVPGGTVEILPEPIPSTYTYKLVAIHPDMPTPLTARAENYTQLIQFFLQLEHMGYFLNNLERVAHSAEEPQNAN
jgi:hypothetical protein